MAGLCISAYQSLFLQQWRFPVKHKYWLDAEEEELTDTVKESEQVSILNTVAFTVPHSFHSLVEPYANIWEYMVKVDAIRVTRQL